MYISFLFVLFYIYCFFPTKIIINSREVEAFALFYEASTVTLIDDFGNELELQEEETSLRLKWTDKVSKMQVTSEKVSFEIIERDKTLYKLNNLYTLKYMDLSIQTITFKQKWKNLEKIDFANYENAKRKLLIGQD